MSPILRNVLAVIAGCIVGFIVNMGIITISPMVIVPPTGVDPTNPESLAAGAHLMEMKHFIMPFLAHALGTLAGAFVAAKIAFSHNLKFALGIGVFFLLGGIAATTIIPAPTWFIILDLLVAYIPMAWLGGKIGGGAKRNI